MKKRLTLSLEFLLTLFLLSTFAIILSNYIFINNTKIELKKYIESYEYSKFWWKENYLILQEIQKEQTNSFLEELNNNNPEYINEIKKKLNINYSDQNYFDKEELDAIFSSWFMTWSTNYEYSLVEFSSYNCEYCKNLYENIDFYNISNENNLNYFLKNMSNINDKEVYNLSKNIECINDKETALKVFDELSLEDKSNFTFEYIEKNNLDITECIDSEKTKNSLENQFWQWIYLWIDVLPTLFIINNDTWEYLKIEWVISQDELMQNIEQLKKK